MYNETAHTHAHTDTHARTRARTHTHTHTHTHAHTHTHKHTKTSNTICPKSSASRDSRMANKASNVSCKNYNPQSNDKVTHMLHKITLVISSPLMSFTRDNISRRFLLFSFQCSNFNRLTETSNTCNDDMWQCRGTLGPCSLI